MPELATWRTDANIAETRTAHPTVVCVETRGITVVGADKTAHREGVIAQTKVFRRRGASLHKLPDYLSDLKGFLATLGH